MPSIVISTEQKREYVKVEFQSFRDTLVESYMMYDGFMIRRIWNSTFNKLVTSDHLRILHINYMTNSTLGLYGTYQEVNESGVMRSFDTLVCNIMAFALDECYDIMSSTKYQKMIKIIESEEYMEQRYEYTICN